jgi:hypothetical protein
MPLYHQNGTSPARRHRRPSTHVAGSSRAGAPCSTPALFSAVTHGRQTFGSGAQTLGGKSSMKDSICRTSYHSNVCVFEYPPGFLASMTTFSTVACGTALGGIVNRSRNGFSERSFSQSARPRRTASAASSSMTGTRGVGNPSAVPGRGSQFAKFTTPGGHHPSSR